MPVDPASLSILTYPHPSLRRRAEAVRAVTDEVRRVAARMIELMHQAEGVGLAAPQVGLPWRLFVANARDEEGDIDRVYINPGLSEIGGEMVAAEEGCLSMPDIRGEVRRPSAITITAIDLEGKLFTMRSEDLLARVWQHEFDHLEGKLIIDRFGQIAKLSNRRQIRRLEQSELI